MSILVIIVVYGLSLSLLLSILLLTISRVNPRLMLQDYPEDVQAVVAAQTPGERRQSLTVGIILLFLVLTFSLAAALTAGAIGYDFPGIFFSAAGVPFLFNVVDWLFLDWLIFCTFTPTFAVLPGTEGMAGYKNYAMHFKGFLKGMLYSVGVGAVMAAIVVAGEAVLHFV